MTTQLLDTVSFTVPADLLTAIFNGDLSGCTAVEEAALDGLADTAAEIAEREGASHWHWSVDPDEQPGFVYHHDLPSLGGAECVTLKLVLMKRDGEPV